MVIVLILLALMGALVVGNSLVLQRLDLELQILERKQVRRLQTPLPGPGSVRALDPGTGEIDRIPKP